MPIEDDGYSSAWTATRGLSVGDEFTLPDSYVPQTWWEWLRRKPKRLQVYRVTEVVNGYTAYRPLWADELLQRQRELTPEQARILNDNLWDLYE